MLGFFYFYFFIKYDCLITIFEFPEEKASAYKAKNRRETKGERWVTEREGKRKKEKKE